jgi:hypothetical protein
LQTYCAITTANRASRFRGEAMKIAWVVCVLVHRPIHLAVALFCAALLITAMQVHADITGLGTGMPGSTQVSPRLR